MHWTVFADIFQHWIKYCLESSSFARNGQNNISGDSINMMPLFWNMLWVGNILLVLFYIRIFLTHNDFIELNSVVWVCQVCCFKHIISCFCLLFCDCLSFHFISSLSFRQLWLDVACNVNVIRFLYWLFCVCVCVFERWCQGEVCCCHCIPKINHCNCFLLWL